MLVSMGAASNYIINGDFEQAVNIGWTQTTSGAGATVTRNTGYDPDPDYEVYLYKSSGYTGYARLTQTAAIPTCNLNISFNAKVYAWDNYSGAWAGAEVRIEYLDDSNISLGKTRICQISYDCPWAAAPDCHHIQVSDSMWHEYNFNLLDELTNIPAVNPNDVAKIKITLNAEVAHC